MSKLQQQQDTELGVSAPAVNREVQRVKDATVRIHSEVGDLITALRTVLTDDQFRRLRAPYEPQTPCDLDGCESMDDDMRRTPLSRELEGQADTLHGLVMTLNTIRQNLEI